MRPLDLEGPINPGLGTITNLRTGAQLHGAISAAAHSPERFRFAIDGATGTNTFHRNDWTFTPDPEPVKDGYYLLNGLVYRINGDNVHVVNLAEACDAVLVSTFNPGLLANHDQAVFMGDLEGNR